MFITILVTLFIFFSAFFVLLLFSPVFFHLYGKKNLSRYLSVAVFFIHPSIFKLTMLVHTKHYTVTLFNRIIRKKSKEDEPQPPEDQPIGDAVSQTDDVAGRDNDEEDNDEKYNHQYNSSGNEHSDEPLSFEPTRQSDIDNSSSSNNHETGEDQPLSSVDYDSRHRSSTQHDMRTGPDFDSNETHTGSSEQTSESTKERTHHRITRIGTSVKRKIRKFSPVVRFIIQQKTTLTRVVRWIGRIGYRLIHFIAFDRFTLYVKAGSEDPSVTGIAHGIFNAVFHGLEIRENKKVYCKFEPVFSNTAVCEYSGTIRAKTTLYRLIVAPVVAAVLYFPYWTAFSQWRNYKRLKKDIMIMEENRT